MIFLPADLGNPHIFINKFIGVGGWRRRHGRRLGLLHRMLVRRLVSAVGFRVVICETCPGFERPCALIPCWLFMGPELQFFCGLDFKTCPTTCKPVFFGRGTTAPCVGLVGPLAATRFRIGAKGEPVQSNGPKSVQPPYGFQLLWQNCLRAVVACCSS